MYFQGEYLDRSFEVRINVSLFIEYLHVHRYIFKAYKAITYFMKFTKSKIMVFKPF
jgi:hypothetical protein